MNEIKILLQPEFEHYHSLLMAHIGGLIDNLKNSLSTFRYHEESRILEFGTKEQFETTVEFITDGRGNVTLSLPVTMSIRNDGKGNVTITGATLIDDNNGNVYIV